jgi:hypothetical protein
MWKSRETIPLMGITKKNWEILEGN